MTEVNAGFASIERRVRANIAKNSKGYTTDTTAEVTMVGGTAEALEAELTATLQLADRVARDEVARRQAQDGEEG